jgi:hypothetical protein
MDAPKKIWTKELKNGHTFRVKRYLDKDIMLDTIID